MSRADPVPALEAQTASGGDSPVSGPHQPGEGKAARVPWEQGGLPGGGGRAGVGQDCAWGEGGAGGGGGGRCCRLGRSFRSTARRPKTVDAERQGGVSAGLPLSVSPISASPPLSESPLCLSRGRPLSLPVSARQPL